MQPDNKKPQISSDLTGIQQETRMQKLLQKKIVTDKDERRRSWLRYEAKRHAIKMIEIC